MNNFGKGDVKRLKELQKEKEKKTPSFALKRNVIVSITSFLASLLYSLCFE